MNGPAGEPPSSQQLPATEGPEWHYAKAGTRIGPVSKKELLDLISSGKIDREASVWRPGQPEWLPAEQTDLAPDLPTRMPPLTGRAVNNSIVWVLAFGPLIGLLIVMAIVRFTGHVDNNWVIFVALNAGLGLLDENRLKAAGHDTKKWAFWAWLFVPAYLFIRARKLRQGYSYAIMWVCCFALMELICLGLPYLLRLAQN